MKFRKGQRGLGPLSKRELEFLKKQSPKTSEFVINPDGSIKGGKISKEDMKKMLDRLQRKNKKFMR
tara:strand:- start:503 stop:700 length:198 start_codon:yes stop_codon:yes gene_type:complete